MTWLFVGLCVLIVGILIYYSIPFFKKLFGNKDYNKRAQKSNDRAIKREEKKVNKISKKESKEKLKNQQRQINSNSDVKLENENAIDLNNDPDEKVDLNNLKYEGYFDDIKSNGELNSKPTQINPLEEDVNTLFNEIYNTQTTSTSDNEAVVPLENRNDSNNDNEEIRDLFEDFENLKKGNNNLADDFNKLSPEMKALMISNFLDKKY